MNLGFIRMVYYLKLFFFKLYICNGDVSRRRKRLRVWVSDNNVVGFLVFRLSFLFID